MTFADIWYDKTSLSFLRVVSYFKRNFNSNLLVQFQSVVSGVVDPDMFIVQRSYRNNNLKVLERKLGDKDSFVHMTADGK